MRFFNTSGPVVPADRYCIPPLERVDLDDICQPVRNKRYFVLHAPRQTGKTSVLLALRDLLNSGAIGDSRCVYFNVEASQAAREDTSRAMRAIFRELTFRAHSTLGEELVDGIWPDMLDRNGPDGALGEVLYRWASADRKRRVVEPLLSGGDERGFTARDIEYVCDLGLVAQDAPLRITNPIYAEVIPRELTWAAQEGFVEDTAWYVDADGELDMVKLL